MDTYTMSRFCDKLIQLRREKGLSQEQLADYVNVSRQAVSKWEAGQTMPALDKIIQLSDFFGVSVDYLVRENATNEEKSKTVVTTIDDTAVMEQLGEIKAMVKKANVYEYKSKTKCFGIPLVHVKFTRNGRPSVAKGIVAIGNLAVGAISIGAMSAGIISFGAINVGLLLGLGAISIGAVAFGAVSAGIMAFGGVAIGMYAFGGIAVANNIAIGGVATGHIAIGSAADGEHAMDIANVTKEEVRTLILQHYPNMPQILLRLFISGCK